VSTDIQKALRALPASVRKSIKDACGGEWDRVVVSADGAITIYNTATLAARARDRAAGPPVRQPAASSSAPPARPVRRPAASSSGPVPAPPPARQPAASSSEPATGADVDEPAPRPRKTMLEALAEKQAALGGRAPVRPGLSHDSQAALERLRAHAAKLKDGPPAPPSLPVPVQVQSAPADPGRRARDVVRRDGDGSDFDPRVLIEQAQSATGLCDFLAGGLPEGAAYLYFPDVADMYGMDFDLVDSVIRNPQEVSVRPETVTKGYPVLKFARGDIQAIMGFKDPQLPMCIAVYFTHRLDHEDRHTRSGGEQMRPPSTGSALLRHLKGMGAEIKKNDARETARVTYKNQSLGQVSTRDHDRDAVRRDFERMARKIRGVDAAEKEKQDADGTR
jgi:hypothetical protein